MQEKCKHEEGATVRIGKYAVDPCLYKRIEGYRNVNVFISRCVYCGAVEISWERTEQTEPIPEEELDN